MSNDEKRRQRDAAEELVAAIKRFQDAVDLFDATAARSLDINSTDLRCLAALRDHGPMNAKEVATRLGLTRGATTTALDRLQKAHLLDRSADEIDGRGVIINLTSKGRISVNTIWKTMRSKGAEHLRSYSIPELQSFQRFFDRSIELQERCTQLLRLRNHSAASEARNSASTKRTKRKRSASL